MTLLSPSRLLGSLTILGGMFLIGPAAFGEAAPAAASPYHVTTKLHLGGEGRWDYALFDPSTKLLYIARQSHVQVVNPDGGKIVADLKGMRGNHGVALVPDRGRGFVSDGQANVVVVFDLKSYKEIGRVPTGQNPDAIIFDPSSGKVMAFDGRGKDVTVIDPAADPGPAAAVAHIPLDGKPEFAVADGHGHVYVNLEDKNSIVQIDSSVLKVAAVWKIEGCEAPSCLAIDPAHHHLFAGCDNHVMAVVDTETGKTLGTAPIGDGVDACGFDSGTGEAFASCGDGTLAVIKETSPGKFEAIQSVQTAQGARTLALDPLTHTLYLPTAEFPAGGGERAKAKPDSFMLVVVSRGAQ